MATKNEVIKKCEELIRSFNSITHSIDTHVQDHLAEKSKFSEDDKSFIQQVLYGWYRHKTALDGFINNFFVDNASKVARNDKILYLIFTYLAVYRLDDLGFPYFKQYASTQDPTKIFNLISYLFNSTNLWSILRAEWMKYYDLTYVEDELIAGIENYIPDCQNYLYELQEKAQGLAAVQQAKQEALKNGTAGLAEVDKKQLTKPISPKLTRPRPAKLPEPIEIPQNVVINEIPSNLDKITLETLEQQRLERLEQIRQQTHAQYSEKHLFKLHTTNHGKNLNDLRQEIEEEQNKELKFNSSYVNIPPDYTAIPARVKLNATTILREDSLYRKQQAKDVQLLKQYEWELRDSSEYYTWQQEMKERDEEEKLHLVNLRRQQAKASSNEAHEAILKQQADNKLIGNILREQSNEIKLQKQLETDLQLLMNQDQVNQIIETREMKPKEAKQKVLIEKQEIRKKLNEIRDEKMREKEMNDALEEEIRADKIRQLKALNTVHRDVIKVFDPTETAGHGVMNEMSYMEMKERIEIERNYQKNWIENKHEEILEGREKRAAMLERKSELIMRARERKTEGTREILERRREETEKKENEERKKRMENAILLNKELEERREKKKREQDLLEMEAERVKRQQQYLGQAMGRVDEVRIEEILKGHEREIKKEQNKLKNESKLNEEVKKTEILNRERCVKEVKKTKREVIQESDLIALRERKRAVEKLKEEYQQKKEKVKTGHGQHERVREIIKEQNRYADRITEESLENARKGTNQRVKTR